MVVLIVDKSPQNNEDCYIDAPANAVQLFVVITVIALQRIAITMSVCLSVCSHILKTA